MAGPNSGSVQALGALAVLAVVVIALSYLQPSMVTGPREGFQATLSAAANYSTPAGGNAMPGPAREQAVKNAPEVVAVPSTGPAEFTNAEQPAGCYPRDQLTPSELLPKDANSIWAQQNPSPALHHFIESIEGSFRDGPAERLNGDDVPHSSKG